MLEHILIWFHLMMMAGALGGSFLCYRTWRAHPEGAGPVAVTATRTANLLVGLGFLGGLALYYNAATMALRNGVLLASRYHAIVGVKLLLLLAIAGVLGMASKKARNGKSGAAAKLSLAAALLIAIAMWLGVLLRG